VAGQIGKSEGRMRWNGRVVYSCYADRRKDGNEWVGGKMGISLCGREEKRNVWVQVMKNQWGMRMKRREVRRDKLRNKFS
jgi:hypothetical protein